MQNMTSEEHSNDKIKKKPMNLFDKILQKCREISITEENNKQKCESLLDYVEDEEESVDLNREDPLSIVDKICCSDKKQSTAAKLNLLTILSEACVNNPKLYDVVGSSPLVYFAEKLLFNYSKAMDLHYALRQLRDNDKSELVLIIPMLKLLVLSANMSIQKIRAIFRYDSEVLLKLMEAAVQCSYNTAVTLKKIQDAVLKKNLVGVMFKMEQQQINELITNYLGFQVASVDLKLEAIHVTLYEETDENINLKIMKNRPPSGETLTGTQMSSEPDPILDCCENMESAEWSDIVVARVTLLKTLFVYTKKDWQDCLTDISNHVKEILQAADINTVHKHHIGALYGFWISDSEIEEQPLCTVPCLRGQVLTLTGDWAMLWIVDVGSIGFVPKTKLHPLSQELADLPSLISVGLLRGPVCTMDDVFLKTVYRLLCIILETNAQIGKHMLLYETGRHILSLIEYPETSVRIAVLSLLLCLAKNSGDVVKFLREQHYDHTLLGKLEKYGHAYTASMFTDKKAMGEEIEKMLMILLLIMEEREDINSWSQNRRASRVVWMYMCDKKCEWRELLEKCLSVLTKRSTRGQQTNSRSHQQFRTRFNRDNTQGIGHHRTENYSSREMQKNEFQNERGWNTHRDYGQRRGRGNYRRNGADSDSRRWNSYNAARQTYEHYQGPPRYRDEQHSRDTDQGHGDNNAETNGSRKNEDGHAMLMKTMETDDHPAPYHPRLPKLNTLRRPTPNPNRVTATYHSLLELCDDIPPAVDTTQAKEICKVDPEAEVEYVIYGTKANVKCDKTHELVLGKKLWDIKEVDLAQKLCGLLNNNVEGSMYFGLNQDSTIEGIWLSRGDKDTFRNGIDRIMNRCLIPEVRVNSYDIIFTPVLQSSDKLMDLTKQSLFIVEIRVWPLVHMVYMVYQNRKCYTRCGTETVECTVAQKKQDMMDEEERNIEECIQELEAAANNDLATLAKLIKKYVPEL